MMHAASDYTFESLRGNGISDSLVYLVGLTDSPNHKVSLDITRDPGSDSQVILKWSTAAVGYDLLATNALQPPPNNFVPIGPAPVVVNSKFTVTNSITSPNRFYELRKRVF
jgi:hypothetical protein